MAMMCKEVLSLASMRDAKVVAGADGLNRPLRWIYVAECFADTTEIADWIFGGELVFVSGVNIKGNPELLLEVVRKLSKKKAAGIAIFVGPYIPTIPEEVLREADKLSFPVFELPWEAKLVTASHDICQALTVKEVEEKTLDNLLVSILFGGSELEEHILMRAEYYGYIPNRPACICIADIDGFAGYLKEHGISEENTIVEIKLNVKRLIHNAIVHRGKAPILMLRSDSVISLIQTRKETAEEFYT
ncbi:MAG: PucR family transcriptional regulator ligand-binding domain-containing protein, partial [Acetanaerobacterium sp.]